MQSQAHPGSHAKLTRPNVSMHLKNKIKKISYSPLMTLVSLNNDTSTLYKCVTIEDCDQSTHGHKHQKKTINFIFILKYFV